MDSSKAHPVVEVDGWIGRSSGMVYAYTSSEGVKLDHYAGELRKLGRGRWIAIDRDGTTYAGVSAEDAARKLPRSIEAMAIYDAREAEVVALLEAAAEQVIAARKAARS